MTEVKKGRGRPPKNEILQVNSFSLEDQEAQILRREYKNVEQQMKDLEPAYVYGDDVYKISKILAKRVIGGRKEYLIKWQGYPKSQSTWEPAEHILDPSIISKFESREILQINVTREDVERATSENDDDEEEEDERSRRRRRKERRSRERRKRSKRRRSNSDEVRRHHKHRSKKKKRLEKRAISPDLDLDESSEEEEERTGKIESGASPHQLKTSFQHVEITKTSTESETLSDIGKGSKSETKVEENSEINSEINSEVNNDNSSEVNVESFTFGNCSCSLSSSNDGDTSGDEIAEEPLSDKEIIFENAPSPPKPEDETENSSSNFSEIMGMLNMMTERIAMEIEGNSESVPAISTEVNVQERAPIADPKSPPQQNYDENNNEVIATPDKEAPEVSHSVEIPEVLSPREESHNIQKSHDERAQGSILGSAMRSSKRVYLIEWSNGSHQILTQEEVKEKWPQLLIKFYENNIHWLRKLT